MPKPLDWLAGGCASLVLHGVLWFAFGGSAPAAASPELPSLAVAMAMAAEPVSESPEPEPEAAEVTPPDEAQPAPVERAVAPPEVPQAQPDASTTESPQNSVTDLAQEHVESAEPPDDLPLEDGGSESAGDAQHDPLVLEWSDAAHVGRVTRALRIRVLAIDASGAIAGEVASPESPRVRPYRGSLAGYSNRVRRLSKQVLDMPRNEGHEIAYLWLVLPVGLDRDLTRVVRAAVDARGLTADLVRTVVVRLDRVGTTYEPRVVEVVAKGGK